MRRKSTGLIFYERKQVLSPKLIREILSLLFYTAITVVIAFLLVAGFGMRIRMVGPAMLPEIRAGQQVFVDRVIYRLRSPSRGDLVVFYPNGNANAHMMIRRVIALPGETVKIEDGIVYVNDKPENIGEKRYDRISDPGIAAAGVTLGSKEYFVMGDLRNAGEDSRSAAIGPVTSEMIIGKAWFWLESKGN